MRQLSSFVQRLALWERNIPKYPIYWEGNPQNRVFLCQFWMKLIKPERKVPPQQVHFEVHPQMSKLDIKQYLKKVYNVPVRTVRTHVVQGERRKLGSKEIADPDRKLAYVHLADGETFDFPSLFDNKTKPSQEQDRMKNDELTKAKEKTEQNWDKISIPPWFR